MVKSIKDTPNSNNVHFGNLKVGDFFKFDNHYYIKIDYVCDLVDGSPRGNAVKLEDGSLCDFIWGSDVTKLSNTTVEMEV